MPGRRLQWNGWWRRPSWPACSPTRLPFNTVSFSYLGANGQARELVRFSYGGKGKVAFGPTAAVNIAQLMGRGFQVRWARPPGEVLPRGSPQR